jgi:hypothetical protein
MTLWLIRRARGPTLRTSFWHSRQHSQFLKTRFQSAVPLKENRCLKNLNAAYRIILSIEPSFEPQNNPKSKLHRICAKLPQKDMFLSHATSPWHMPGACQEPFMSGHGLRRCGVSSSTHHQPGRGDGTGSTLSCRRAGFSRQWLKASGRLRHAGVAGGEGEIKKPPLGIERLRWSLSPILQ